ncbi:MAG: outer membrane beta-barrel protein [Albidovulum sp.]|nr:outer membrane beta-barrel protein [Albidovulum sp.]MDE0305600.1 outer membrane beta-barrel protein [Albidovulum sp.]MDE0533678.1 outer membrane beta-barrel protein [Albidovulum sp.]
MVLSFEVAAQTVAEKPFYMRFGGVVEHASETRFIDIECDGPRRIHGCGTGPDGLKRGIGGQFGTAGGFEVGFGYRVAPGFRLEGIIQSRPPFKFNGHSNYNLAPENQRATAEVSTLSVMSAAFYDFPETISMPFGDFRPYFGSGVGYSRNKISETRISFPNTTTVIPSGQTSSISAFLAIGILMPVSEVITLDIAWRYTELGQVETGPGNAYVEYRDGRPAILLPVSAETRGHLRSNGLAMSLIVPF